MAAPAFHLAFAVDDLAAAEAFYVGLLGCRKGRQTERWIDLDFWGHQLSAHLSPRQAPSSAGAPPAAGGEVDGDAVPVRHFGVILEWSAWEGLRDRLSASGIAFLLGPKIRFVGEPGEQATMFVCDPSGNALEFKAYRHPEGIFAE